MIKTLVVVLVLAVSTKAHAGWLFEPYAGYGTGTTDAHVKATAQLPNGADAGDTFTELSTGARLGYKFGRSFWLAADPQFGLSGMAKSSSSGYSDAYTRTQVYGDVGWDLSIFRTYLGYGFINQQDFDGTKSSGGLALKAGVGIELFSRLSLNVEYHMNNFKETVSNGVTTQDSDTFDKFQQSEFVVGLTIPFGGISERR